MKKYIYLSREEAKKGIALVFAVLDEPINNMEEYFERQACLFVSNDLPHFITYIEDTDTVREATEEEKLIRHQRALASNEIIDKEGKIISYNPYFEKIINNEVVDKTREDCINEEIITLNNEKLKARIQREKELNAVDLYDKAVLRGDIVETPKDKKERDLFRNTWLEIPNNYKDLNTPIEQFYPTPTKKIKYFM